MTIGDTALELLIGIDDTDNIESRGTGQLAAILAREVENRGLGKCLPVTRHQMLVHPDIPYTSHNSAMCFPATVPSAAYDDFVDQAQTFLRRESAEGSDPGLCIIDQDRLRRHPSLVAFGMRAKREVLQKEDAYALAERLGIHLSEHGGTGLGVIGALAGCGLRLTGNDGRFRGHFQVGPVGGELKVFEVIQQTGVDRVQSLDGETLPPETTVRIGEKVKAVLLDGKSTLLVYDDSGNGSPPCWKTCTKKQLRVY